jgi:3'(2'), 5'-bisphosphate nucleotidase|tara:strand:+ start:179 stop:973 length:795 start_codon:yes stop_codon:yes gene_type:complete
MTNLKIKELIKSLVNTFLYAGEISINLRNNGLTQEMKPDNTPVSNGDLEVNKIIIKKLKELTPSIPIISEETSDNKSTKNLENFWLVDPIDGTYDYINYLDEFTINAGLILNQKTVAGLIYAPAKKRMFYSYGEGNAYELINNKEIRLDGSRNFKKNNIKFVSYSNKIKPEIQKIFDKLKVKEYKKMKSSLKFCVVATGEYDGYVAEPRACEWDIAAGHAILKHSGGTVTDFNNQEISYGKKDFKNPSIILKSNKLNLWMNSSE